MSEYRGLLRKVLQNKCKHLNGLLLVLLCEINAYIRPATTVLHLTALSARDLPNLYNENQGNCEEWNVVLYLGTLQPFGLNNEFYNFRYLDFSVASAIQLFLF